MGVLPVGFRPPIDLTFSYGGRDNMSQRAINIKTDGTMTYSNMGGQQGSSPFGATYTYIV